MCTKTETFVTAFLFSLLTFCLTGFGFCLLWDSNIRDYKLQAIKHGYAHYEQNVVTNKDMTITITDNVFKWNKP